MCVFAGGGCSTKATLKDQRHCLYFFISSGNICRNLSPVILTFTKCQYYFHLSFVSQKNTTVINGVIKLCSACCASIYIFDRWLEAPLWGVAARCCQDLDAVSCSSHLHVWLSTYALLFHHCSENDLCCGRVLIGLAPQCVCAPVCACTSAQMFAYVYVSMLTAWAVSEALSAARHMWLSTSLSGSFLCS